MNAGDVAWMLMASSMVLFMTPGLAFFYGGMVSAKNVISTMLQCFIAVGVVSVLWVIVGFSLSFGASVGGFVGNPLTYFMFEGVSEATDARLSPTIPLLLFAFAVRRLRLTTIGMFQYIAPSIQFLVAIFLFGEHLNGLRLLSFALIWVSLMVFSWDSFQQRRRATA